jgi:hypothetical protein
MVLRFGDILRIVSYMLLFLAVTILIFFLSASLNPNGLRKIGVTYLNFYERSAKELSKNAISDIQNGQLDNAIELLTKWEDIQKGDRLYPLKREIYIELTEQWMKSDTLQPVIDYGAPFLQRDERDLEIFARWVAAAVKIDSAREKALALISKNWYRFPQEESVSELFFKHAFSWSDKQTIEAHIVKSFYGTTPNRWSIYWRSDGPFNQKDMSRIILNKKNGNWTSTFTVPSTAKFVRFDPTPFHVLSIRNFSVKEDDGKSVVLRAVQGPMNQVQRTNGTLKTSGGNDPYFTVDIQEFCYKNGCPEYINLIIHLDIKKMLPEWLEAKVLNS